MASDDKNENKEEKSTENDQANQNDKRKERTVKKTFARYEPYGRRNKVFVSNIPFDVKWQALKDLIKELVGEVTYVELLTDAEGKSRGCAAVEFKTEETLKKAVNVLNKHNLSGRPLKVKEDLEGEHLRRAMQKMIGGMGGPMGIGGMAGPMGIGGPMGVMGPNGMGGHLGPLSAGPGVPIPPSILNNPNIANEIIHALQAGRLGSTVFIANLDYSVGWKKLKEVFGMAGVVVRTDILEDKEGKSRGIGTVTYEQSIEAVQAISMFNGQLLFDRPMVVKMDDKSMPKGDSFPPDRPHQLPRGLAGIGMGLGPGGQPIDAHLLNRSGAVIPGGIDGIGFGMNKMGGIDGHFSGNGAGIGLERGMALERSIALDRGIDRFASSMSMGRLPDVERSTSSFERDFVRSGLTMSGSYGDALDRVMSSGSALSGMDRMSTALGPGLDRMGGGLTHGLDRVPSDIDRLGLVIDRLGSSGDRMSSSGMDRLGSLGMEAMAPSVERIGMDRLSSVERMGSGMGYGVERMGSTLERVASALDRIGSVDRMGSSSIDRMGVGMVSSSMDRMGSGMDRMGQVMDRLSSPVDRLASGSMGRIGLDRVGASAMDRLGPSIGQPMGSGIDRIGLGMGVGFDRPMEMDLANFGGGFGGGFGGSASGTPAAASAARKGCQIFVRNLSYDFTWKMLKEKFNDCGHVVYADIKMENGKSKGCGVVKFESPEMAERACRLMDGIKLGGREIDVRMDRNA